MIDAGIKEPNYRHTKDIVDEIIKDEDYRYSGEPYHDDRVTWLEVLRISYAHFMAASSSKIRTRKDLEKPIDHAGIQDWLDWVHNVQSGGIDDGYNIVTVCDSYRHSPGIARWKSFSTMRFDGSVRGAGKKDIFFNRLKGYFQDKMPTVDDEVRQIASDKVQKAIDMPAHAGASFDIGKGKIGLRVMMRINLRTSEGVEGAVWHSPFAFDEIDLTKRIDEALCVLNRLAPLSRQVREDIRAGGWPDEEPVKVVFHADPKQNEDQVTIHMQNEQYGHDLNAEEQTRFVGRLTIPCGTPDSKIIELYNTPPTPAHPPGNTLADAVLDSARIETKKLKRRASRLSRNGEGNIEIDGVTSHVLDLVVKHHPDKREEILSGKTVTVRMPIEAFDGFVTGRRPKGDEDRPRRKTETVSFKLDEGKLRARIHLSDHAYWDRTRLLVHGLPQTVLASLAGKNASELMEHPITKLLGTVRSAYKPKHSPEKAWISFNPVSELVAITEDKR